MAKNATQNTTATANAEVKVNRPTFKDDLEALAQIEKNVREAKQKERAEEMAGPMEALPTETLEKLREFIKGDRAKKEVVLKENDIYMSCITDADPVESSTGKQGWHLTIKLWYVTGESTCEPVYIQWWIYEGMKENFFRRLKAAEDWPAEYGEAETILHWCKTPATVQFYYNKNGNDAVKPYFDREDK